MLHRTHERVLPAVKLLSPLPGYTSTEFEMGVLSRHSVLVFLGLLLGFARGVKGFACRLNI